MKKLLAAFLYALTLGSVLAGDAGTPSVILPYLTLGSRLTPSSDGRIFQTSFEGNNLLVSRVYPTEPYNEGTLLPGLGKMAAQICSAFSTQPEDSLFFAYITQAPPPGYLGGFAVAKLKRTELGWIQDAAFGEHVGGLLSGIESDIRLFPDGAGGCFIAANTAVLSGQLFGGFGRIAADGTLVSSTLPGQGPLAIGRFDGALTVVARDGIFIDSGGTFQRVETPLYPGLLLESATIDPSYGIVALGVNTEVGSWPQLMMRLSPASRIPTLASPVEKLLTRTAPVFDHQGRILYFTTPDPERDEFQVRRQLPDSWASDDWSPAVKFRGNPLQLMVLPNNDAWMVGLVSAWNGTPTSLGGPTVYRLAGAGTGNSSGMINTSAQVTLTSKKKYGVVGFVIRGDTSVESLIRVVGPTLKRFGITQPARRPRLILYQGPSQIHDSWPQGLAPNEPLETVSDTDNTVRDTRLIELTMGAFALGTLKEEPEFHGFLTPGAYTVFAYGEGEEGSEMLVEVYQR